MLDRLYSLPPSVISSPHAMSCLSTEKRELVRWTTSGARWAASAERDMDVGLTHLVVTRWHASIER